MARASAIDTQVLNSQSKPNELTEMKGDEQKQGVSNARKESQEISLHESLH